MSQYNPSPHKQSNPANNPFVRDAGVDKPGIIGARWWNRAIQEVSPVQGRRSSLSGCIFIGGGIALLGGVTIYACSQIVSDDDEEEFTEEQRRSVQLQRDYGWNFGAVSETVALDAAFTSEYAREAFKRVVDELSPNNAAHRPHYVQTLFESPEALPRLTLPDGETSRVRPLAEVIKPINTPTMKTAEQQGRALGKLISQATGTVLTIVDLPGPEAVAFAAGAAPYLDPIFLFDNWPHPRGVVPAHLTLAAALFHQPVFAKAKVDRKATAYPMAVLDRNRLASYADNASQFDNRYLAKLPNVTPKYVLYVVPTQMDLPEKDDLNAAFVAYKQASVDVKAIAADAFVCPASGECMYGTNAQENEAFFHDYPWNGTNPPARVNPRNASAATYTPATRTTSLLNPTTVGVAVVVLAAGTGLLLGSKLNRNGSWNRSTSYGGG